MATSLPPTPQPEMVPVQISWIWYFNLGLVFLLLGVAGLGMTVTLTYLSVLFGGILLIVAGIVQIAGSPFVRAGVGSFLVQVLCGLLYLGAGVLAITDPELVSAVFTLWIAVSLIVTGVARVLLAFLHRRFLGWLAMMLGGVLTMALGVYILNRWPWDSAWVIGLFFAIDLISQGISWIALGLNIRAAGGR